MDSRGDCRDMGISAARRAEARSKGQELRASPMDFKLVSDYKPQGDQGRAIESLLRGVYDREQHQVLLGVTGSGKTYTMAKVIEAVTRPSPVLLHNDTPAAPLLPD